METFNSEVIQSIMHLVELKYVLMKPGVLSVMTIGTTMMLVFYAGSWVSLIMVSSCIVIIFNESCIGAISKTSFYNESLLPHTIFDVNCDGSESSIFDCLYSTEVPDFLECNFYEDASVICQGIKNSTL